MRRQLIRLHLLTLVALLVASTAAETLAQSTTKPKIEPLASAYTDLLATKERFAEYERMTEVQKLAGQLEQLEKAAKAIRNKTYSVRLRVSAVTQPLGPRRVLVHGQYVDPEQIRLFGKDATVGVWTDDPKTAGKLYTSATRSNCAPRSSTACITWNRMSLGSRASGRRRI